MTGGKSHPAVESPGSVVKKKGGETHLELKNLIVTGTQWLKDPVLQNILVK